MWAVAVEQCSTVTDVAVWGWEFSPEIALAHANRTVLLSEAAVGAARVPGSHLHCPALISVHLLLFLHSCAGRAPREGVPWVAWCHHWCLAAPHRGTCGRKNFADLVLFAGEL